MMISPHENSGMNDLSATDPCPCGSGRLLESCCGPRHDGTAPAETAEALMRSRYSAYVRQRIDYLRQTLTPEAQAGFDPAETERWARESQWSGLSILRCEAGGPEDETGLVEFVATYQFSGRDFRHHEISRFTRLDGRWFYVDGQQPALVPRTAPRIGRNDPCTCGSGRKYKKCCGS
jgi:SEC-C motif domain protein